MSDLINPSQPARYRFICKLLIGLFLGVAAANGASAKKILGAGLSSCREWQENRTAKNLFSIAQQSWIAGYLSGYNVATNDRDFLMPKPDSDAIYIWLDNYCRNKPLDDLMHAVTALKAELEARAR